ncbi:MAG: heavy-metal-associated domain-containing protein [Desulfovibrionaceae bacterium]|nr:heavy-metal-associated domain-containing protein [Desulfovibrionaceae bacterium]
MNKILKIEGMSCENCAAAVEKALLSLPGVAEVKVDLAAGNAAVMLQDLVGDKALMLVVEEAGFEVVGVE